MTQNILARVLSAPDIPSAFSDEALIAAMLRFEFTLAHCQERLGLIPSGVAAVIDQHARELDLDAAVLVKYARASGSLVIPLVHSLTASVQSTNPAAARYVHFGATSQDAIDSALAACTVTAIASIDAASHRAIVAATRLARNHAADPVLARTLLQAAGVTTFGWKFAHAALALARCRTRLQMTAHHSIAVSLGGPTGSLSTFGHHGATLRAALAHEMGLADPGASWHSHRDRWLALATDTALMVGTAAKIAGDIALMAQNEVGELSLSNTEGTGRSSAMPHKHNPVAAIRVLAAAQPVPGIIASLLGGMRQAHERAFGEWQSELAQWSSLFDTAVDATAALATLLDDLHPDTTRARVNIDAQFGVLFSATLADRLSAALGRTAAHAMVATLCANALRDRQPLVDVALAMHRYDPRLASISATTIEAAFSLDAATATSVREVEELLAQIQQ